ncbi:MAG TPA: flagellar export chaperone FlgN [Acidimicrobiales bacterium]|nr:flagellar export chaperone FlgN [Acidimicrobiales bacterium]
MRLREVSDILWRERRLLELLQFKLTEEQLLVAAGRVRWLPSATREVELIMIELQRAELTRAVAVDELAVDLGLAPNASLGELALAAPDPWNGVFERHRHALDMAVQEVNDLADQSHRLLACKVDDIRAALEQVGATP